MRLRYQPGTDLLWGDADTFQNQTCRSRRGSRRLARPASQPTPACHRETSVLWGRQRAPDSAEARAQSHEIRDGQPGLNGVLLLRLGP
jgi:hypothetical protein